MTVPPPTPSEPPPSPPAPSVGLRLRLWIGCVGGTLVAAGGTWWVIGVHTGPAAQLDLPLLVWWLSAVAVLSLIVALVFALWLDRGVIGHLRGLIASLASGRVTELRGLPAGSGWGELSELTQALQSLLTHHRHAVRATQELGLLREQVGLLRESLERWNDTERWAGPRVETGLLAPVTETLDRGLKRLDEVRDQNLEAVRQVGAAVESTVTDARETAGESERAFVEATALMTTVRELQRLTGELGQSLATLGAEGAAAAPAGSAPAWREAARAAIEDLVDASSGSVEHLGRGLARVQEIADQVHVVSNRATLIALHAALASARQGRAEEAIHDEMKRLAAEVREASERTTRYSREIEGEIAAATERMRGLRERVASRLEALPAEAPAAPPAPSEETVRLQHRLREMVQDATQKGERLSAANERVSRAAGRLVRRLEEEMQDVAGLAVRLSPTGSPDRGPAGGSVAETAPPAGETGARPHGLRLLGQEHLMPGEPPAPRRARGPGGEDRS